MNSDLMHAASVRLAEHNACLSIVAKLFESCRTFLALGRNFANANLVAHNLNRLFAFDDAPKGKLDHVEYKPYKWIKNRLLRKLSFDTTNVLLLHLSISYLVLHLSRFLRTAPEKQ